MTERENAQKKNGGGLARHERARKREIESERGIYKEQRRGMNGASETLWLRIAFHDVQ